VRRDDENDQRQRGDAENEEPQVCEEAHVSERIGTF
jgi:hypothetical protein